MAQTILLTPTSEQVGLEFTAKSLQELLEQKGNRTTTIKLSDFNATQFEELIAQNRIDAVIDIIVEHYFTIAKDVDVVMIQGLYNCPGYPYAAYLHRKIADALNANIIIVTIIDYLAANTLPTKIKLTKTLLGQDKIGCIINKIENLGCSGDCAACHQHMDPLQIYSQHPIFTSGDVRLLGCIPLIENNVPQLAMCYLSAPNIASFLANARTGLTPAIFRYNIAQTAKKAGKTIVLPEGTEIRTIQAANICAEQQLTRCLLLGKPEAIKQAAQQAKLQLNSKLEIIDPDTIRDKYVAPMVELRKNKGLTADDAKQQLEDNVVLGTMMVQMGDADGLVSGAEHTTADTIRPALQLIKMPANTKLVSSVLFICLPKQVVVFADCAINPKPNAEQLADIAIQSADSAKRFGIEPKVAMISYSTGSSGSGEDVEKVRAATKLVQELRPDLEVDGPLQYDAAIMPEVATQKLPNSNVAGQATVFVFPELNTGNTVYKAVQRTGNLLAIGPMLQGLNKPVNDLSRGCLVEDIVFTIVLTAIQAINHNLNA